MINYNYKIHIVIQKNMNHKGFSSKQMALAFLHCLLNGF